MTTPGAGGAHTDEQVWWQKPFRMFQTNIREIDAGLDVDRVLDRIIDYGANAWLLSVGGIISNYPTALPHQSPNPRLADRPAVTWSARRPPTASRRGLVLHLDNVSDAASLAAAIDRATGRAIAALDWAVPRAARQEACTVSSEPSS